MEASNYLQTKELNKRCVEFMVRNLDISNCVAVLRLADQLNLEKLLQDTISFIGDHFQLLFQQSDDFKHLPVELCEFVHHTSNCLFIISFLAVAKCIKSDRIILYTKYGTVLPAIQREEALVSIIVKYIKFDNYSVRVKDAW